MGQGTVNLPQNPPQNPTPTPTPTPKPGSGGSGGSGKCAGVAAWSAAVAYTGGAKVTYNNQLWVAKWWTQANPPSNSGTFFEFYSEPSSHECCSD